MKLENSVIKTLFIGAARVWDTPDGLKYSRLSETQAETWKKRAIGLIKSYCPAKG